MARLTAIRAAIDVIDEAGARQRLLPQGARQRLVGQICPQAGSVNAAGRRCARIARAWP